MLCAGLLALVAAAPGGAQEAGAPKAHPRLVSAQSTRCTTCHQALFDGKAVVHPPAQEDCTACHTVDVGAEATHITLSATGPELCTVCHDGLAAAATGELKVPHAPVTDACTNCHVPHAGAVPKLLTQPVAELCTSCHDLADLQKAHDGQLGVQIDCTACHAAHGSAQPKMLNAAHLHAPFADKSCEACHRAPFAGRVRLQTRGEALCTACHGDLATAPAGGSVHAALRATGGAGGCLSCHAPHLSQNAKLLLRSGPAVCGTCHPAVVAAAQAKTGHAAAAEDCLACHAPHNAAKPRLLSDVVPGLCLNCHDATDEALKKAHLGADVATLDCTGCHSPHGAGQPKLLARHVHAPLADGCGTCHEGAASKLVENGESALCLACHSDVGEQAQKAKVPHAGFEAARCADCHNPHASPQEHLVKSPGAGPCADCHDDQVAKAGESQHGAVSLVGCRACHEPHGGERPKLLRAEGNALCLGCHDGRQPPAAGEDGSVKLAGRFEVSAAAAKTVKSVLLSADGRRGHPVPNHPVSGTASKDAPRSLSFTGELSCLACHDPHKGRVSSLRWNAAVSMEACLKCHPK